MNKKNILPSDAAICTIDESIKGAASLGRYGITFDGNIDVIVHYQHLFDLLFNPVFISNSPIWPVHGMKLDLPKNIDKMIRVK